MKNKKIIVWLLKLFISWRLILLLITWVAVKLIPYKAGFLGGGEFAYQLNPLYWAWANFDGGYYLAIARQGYLQFQQAFFPFYPLLIRFLARFLKDYLFSSLLISHLAFLAVMYLFYRLTKLDFGQKAARMAVLFLLLFPTSFYFGSAYTEALFLALVLASFYAARRRAWLWMGIFGCLASATRLVGIFLLPALIVERWQAQKDGDRRWLDFWPLLLILAGLVSYMVYLQKTVGDPLYFVHLQGFLKTGRTGGRIILPYQVCWRYLKMICTTKADVLYFTVWLELLTSGLFLGLIIFSYRQIRLSYFIFMVLAYITPTLSGTFSSMPRYVLILFPGFMVLPLLVEKHSWFKRVYLFFAIILGMAAVMLFTRGYWVA